MYILSAMLSKKIKKQYQELNKKHHGRSYKHWKYKRGTLQTTSWQHI